MGKVVIGLESQHELCLVSQQESDLLNRAAGGATLELEWSEKFFIMTLAVTGATPVKEP